ncbi:hypothetical protein [Roseobacter sinensis]|uniref:Uncharacterized protein n=1 Tax=Roseobacter sinensis TaxID=2931391 RepID=A0ABT3BCD2_9RHOB|nr:hypothetical protein [Roseobacter sp. WL0113]MCV3271236.1 hypothetical protein [Roseobacter sp. WL0113]
MTNADSDKRFKTVEHRGERLKLKETNPPHEVPAASKTFDSRWAIEKDGKQWIDRARFPELTRK